MRQMTTDFRDPLIWLLLIWLTGIAGGALTTYGIMRRDWLGTTLAVLGGYAVVRGLTGHCYVYQTLGVNMAPRPTSPTKINAIA